MSSYAEQPTRQPAHARTALKFDEVSVAWPIRRDGRPGLSA
jgi:hypothetical protein